MWFAPMLEGYMPVAIAARLGAQTPEVEYKLGYITPSSANLVKWGVTTVESPKGGIYAPYLRLPTTRYWDAPIVFQ